MHMCRRLQPPVNVMQKILFTNHIAEALTGIASELAPQSVHIVTDDNVARDVLPALGLPWAVITVRPGDDHKNLDSLSHIWQELISQGATRHSLVLNIGGGVVTDMGGFAAATFKRGVRFVNVPTTLLAAVDAAVGGKTGINFGGFKNEVGAFAPADAVVISTATFKSLPPRELLSGYAEMIKHGLLTSTRSYHALLAFDPVDGDPDELLKLLEESVKVKERIVEIDPREQGIRRALNLGHTAGHAFESLALERGLPVPHGYAVAWGMVVELLLSHMIKGLDVNEVRLLVNYLKESGYGWPEVTCDDYPRLMSLMAHDKKNPSPDRINFTLLRAPGDIEIDCIVPPDDITAALDIFRESL